MAQAAVRKSAYVSSILAPVSNSISFRLTHGAPIVMVSGMAAYKRSIRETKELQCEYCGKTFTKEVWQIENPRNNSTANLCSRKCNGDYASRIKYGDTIGYGFYASSARKRAVKKGFEFDLDAQYLKDLFESQKGLCAISGLPVMHNTKNRTMAAKSPYYASVDRIDSSKGYIKGNVQFVCLAINYMRNTFTIQQAKEFVDALRS